MAEQVVKSNTVEDKNKSKKSRLRGKVFINEEGCKGCKICVEFCPADVLALSKGFNTKGYHPVVLINPAKCTGCELCGLYCPDFAIFAKKIKK